MTIFDIFLATVCTFTALAIVSAYLNGLIALLPCIIIFLICDFIVIVELKKIEQ